ncbi:MAG: putative Transposon Ty3-G Gag-Pol polyprotein [Streblomastix strix]|uniref:Putative Transposon Ty3-G Gag-Pol polyprotein n=1 Tax=Streblomastix strix TaxID=222440 RepID=A0A5J4U8W1_9EUKA|nr:MAG: putative Transposon Ty3-G Gag-Pol polyprotein [Streblomastix strix]
MIKKANGKWRKILDAKALNKQIADFHFKMHDQIEVKQTIRLGDWSTSLDLTSAFHPLIIQTESQPYLAFEFQNNHYTYRAMPFETKHSPIYFATSMESIMQQIRMKTEIRIINQIDDILLLHQNKEYLKNMTLQVMNILKYFGFTMNMEKSEAEPNQTVIFLGWEWNLANAIVQTKPKKRLLLLHDLYNMRRWIKTGTEIAVKQTAKLIGKLKYLRLQFQDASLFLNTMDHQKAQAAKLRGWNTTMIMNKTAIPDINLIDSETQGEHSSTINIDTTTNDNVNRCSSKWMGFNTGERTGNDSNGSWNLEQKISEVINQQQRNQSYNLRPTKFRQNLKEFASSIPSDQKRQRYSSFRHQKMESINIINK